MTSPYLLFLALSITYAHTHFAIKQFSKRNDAALESLTIFRWFWEKSKVLKDITHMVDHSLIQSQKLNSN